MASYSFTYNQEIGHQGQSLVPHYPGGRSGVTIGPGYDLGHRSPQEIYNDLTAAGIDPETAYALIDAAHKTGPDAANWVAQRGGIIITEEQQQALFENVLVPEYEERAKDQLLSFVQNHGGFSPEAADWESLSEKQKEILFDYVYNTGGLSRFPELTAAVLNEDWEEAAYHYERFSGDEPLAYRNQMFYQQYLDPAYMREEADWPGTEAELPAEIEEDLSDQIEDLYADDGDSPDTPEADNTDDWYETYT
ncbi:pesticin C-terminus-like muramidase [Salmonirosea aquatica]|uniref:Pesticin C-terminal domain-containing protein n=1 Tax=Salmonirosea aquatica TaxID=2654236 RepID=A0A7C9FZC0_9BACT|nr:hypothetical protein [Cytophagaceae bacterium SJW1-29]